jgi:hypothetical protein
MQGQHDVDAALRSPGDDLINVFEITDGILQSGLRELGKLRLMETLERPVLIEGEADKIDVHLLQTVEECRRDLSGFVPPAHATRFHTLVPFGPDLSLEVARMVQAGDVDATQNTGPQISLLPDGVADNLKAGEIRQRAGGGIECT